METTIVYIGLYRDNGKQNGKDYNMLGHALGLRDRGVGFRGCGKLSYFLQGASWGYYVV